MKIERILFIVMAVLLCSTVCHAQTKDEVSLVVSGDGANKEEATKVALRSAIEQAYGTFVSANTAIVNDELIKDEIATVSSGNIKSYEEVAVEMLPDGRTTVTLKAVVCPSKLISYAQSKGVSTEFAGATFAMNMKIKELNKKNEELALQHLITQMEAMIPYSYSAELVIEEPANARETDFIAGNYGCIDMIYDWFSYVTNKTGKNYEQEKADLKGFFENINNYYRVRMNIKFKANKTAISMFQMMQNVFRSLSLSDSEIKEYSNQNIPYAVIHPEYIPGMEEDRSLCFRSPEGIQSFWEKLQRLLYENFSGFCIMDNLGNKSFYNEETLWTGETDENHYYENSRLDWAIRGDGLFNPIAYVETNYTPKPDPYYGFALRRIAWEVSWKINVAIPKNEISKYSKFDLKRKKTVQGMDTYPSPDPNEIATVVDRWPSYPDWEGFLSSNIRYPAYVSANVVRNGYVTRVAVEFVVEKDGSLTDIKVTKGVEDSLDKEAMRVVKCSSGHWKPAMKDGKYVRYRYGYSVIFDLRKCKLRFK